MSFYNKGATVIKMAVIGDVVKDPNDLIVLGDQISSFQYTLLGGDAYKFKIELVNYSEVFLTSITKAINTLIKSKKAPEYTDVGPDSGDLQSLPKLLIQWGYEDVQGKEALSAIHAAAVTTVDYKFSQGKEKILIIEAVFVPENVKGSNPEVDATYESTVLVDVDMPMITEAFSNPEIYINRHGTTDHLSISQIVQETVKQFIGQLDGFEVELIKNLPYQDAFEVKEIQYALSHKMQLEDTKAVEDFSENEFMWGEWNSYARAGSAVWAGTKILFSDEAQEQRGGANSIRMKTFYPANNSGYGKARKDSLTGAHVRAATRESEAEELYWDKLESIFKFIGLTFTRMEHKDILEELVLRTGNQTTGKRDNGIYGDLQPIAEGERAPELSNSTPVADTLAQAKIDSQVYYFKIDHNCGNPTHDDMLYYFFEGQPPAGIEYLAYVKGVPQSAIDSLNTTGSFFHDIQRGDLFSDTPFEDMTFPIVFTDNTQIELTDGTITTIRDLVTSTEAAITAAAQDNEKLADVQAEEANVPPPPPKPLVPFSEMSLEAKVKFVNSKIKISCVSEEGESVFQTSQRIIDRYNDYAKGSWAAEEGYEEDTHGNQMDMYIDGVTYEDGSFQDLLEDLSSFPREARTTHCRIGRKGLIDQIRKESMTKMPVRSSDVSFPVGSISPEGLDKLSLDSEGVINDIVNLTYGYSDSIVKFFDFKGDIRWLRNATVAAVNTHHLTGVYPHLQANQIRKGFVPIAEMLLKDTEFLEAMEKISEEREDDEPSVTETLQALMGTVSFNETVGHQKPPKILKPEDLSHVIEYMKNRPSNADLEDSFGGDFTKSMSTFNLFLESMLNNQALDLLMDKKGNRYYLKDQNVYDIRATNTESHAANTALQQYASNLDMVAEVRLKTLGIPEISRLVDLSHRAVHLTVADPSEANPNRTHWLTGLYTITSLNHTISASEGYSSEFKLIRSPN